MMTLFRSPKLTQRTITFLMVVAGSVVTGIAPAQPASTPAQTPKVTTRGPAASIPVENQEPTSRIPQRETLLRMQRPITITFNETRLEDAIKFLQEITRADIEPMWADERNTNGLEKDKTINLVQEKGTALNLLEKVLEKATTDVTPGGNTWQLSDLGTLQIGPRERLNKFKRIEIYPIRDLLLDLPNYNNAPEFDLQSVLQSSGNGGGGGQSPFRENQEDEEDRNPQRKQEKVADLQSLLTTLVEPEQWSDNGGEAATIRYFQDTFIITAPDYIHRQINGYPYWPSTSTRVAHVKGRRYVSLGVDTATSQLNGIENQPITGPK